MPGSGQYVAVCSLMLWLCTATPCLSINTSSANEIVAPERNISVVEVSPDIPEWKSIWDHARELAKNENFIEAAQEYEKIFTLKKNVEEVQWEYCKVLVRIGRYEQAAKIVTALLESNPHRIDYLLAGGNIALQQAEFQLAGKRFGLAYEKDPAGVYSDEALAGLAASARSLGKKEISLSLNLQLLARQPENVELIHTMALDAVSLSRYDLAKSLYYDLLEKAGLQGLSVGIVQEFIALLDRLEFFSEELPLIIELIRGGIDTEKNRIDLVQIYSRLGLFQEAFEQASTLVNTYPGNTRYLRVAGNIALEKLARPDKALSYFEQLHALEPDDQEISGKIAGIQKMLASDFLAIVENGGAPLLWGDLLKISPNPKAIYLEMADLLAGKNKKKELIEIFSTVLEHFPGDEAIALKLARQYFSTGNYRATLTVLEKISSKDGRNKEYYLFRSQTEKLLGLEQSSLDSALLALGFDPADNALTLDCLSLSGRLGLEDHLDRVFSTVSKIATPPQDVFNVYLEQLAKNSLFARYKVIFNQAKETYSQDRDYQDMLEINRAKVLNHQGKTRESEEILRVLLNAGRGDSYPAVLLAEYSLDARKYEDAAIWINFLEKKNSTNSSHNQFSEIGLRTALLKFLFSEKFRDGSYPREQIRQYVKNGRFLNSKKIQLTDETLDRMFAVFCAGEIAAGQDITGKQCIQKMQSLEKFDATSYLILNDQNHIPDSLFGSSASSSLSADTLEINGKPLASNLLDVVELEIRNGLNDSAEEHLRKVHQELDKSTRLNALTAQLYFNQGKVDAALQIWEKLCGIYPEEGFFYRKRIEGEMRKGRYDSGLRIMFEWYGKARTTDELYQHLVSQHNYEDTLLLARIKWGQKHHKEALRMYKKLLSPAAIDVVTDKFREQKINYLEYSREKSFWNSMMVLLQAEPDMLEELMKPEFLVENLGNQTGTIVASKYKLYSWQKYIQSEYLARKAIYDKNYYFAEQSYRKLIEDENREGLKDLAEIYSRLGKHRKEAQIYEEIQNRGEQTPEILYSMERNSQQLSPQNSGELLYNKRQGRDGFVDIVKSSVGSSFVFTPDLNTDASFSYANNTYESDDSSEFLGSNSLYGSTTFEIFKGYELNLGAGTEKLNDESDFSLLYRMAFKGQLDEYFNAFVVVDRRPVDDTVSAIRQQITKQSVETGLNCETPLGVAFGLSVLHLDYTGENTANQFNAYSSYNIFGETIHLSFRYDYEYLSGSNDDFSDPESIDETAIYWLPSTYNEHMLSISFQQDFLGYQKGGKKGTSYYIVNAGVGYEDNDNIIYSGGVEFFLEMDPHFLLKGNFNFTQSSEYEDRGLSLALYYRW